MICTCTVAETCVALKTGLRWRSSAGFPKSILRQTAFCSVINASSLFSPTSFQLLVLYIAAHHIVFPCFAFSNIQYFTYIPGSHWLPFISVVDRSRYKVMQRLLFPQKDEFEPKIQEAIDIFCHILLNGCEIWPRMRSKLNFKIHAAQLKASVCL